MNYMKEGFDSRIEYLARQIVDACFCIHKELGPGLLESVYESCLIEEFKLREISCESQVALPVQYKGISVENGFRLDLLVENKIIIELKAVETLLPVHKAQVLTYMKLRKCKLGFLINFNVPLIKNGINRIVL